MAENMKDLNRIKVVLVEKKRTNKWLAEQLGKDPATISKWCTNSSQPDLATLAQVANLLEVDVKDLLNSTQPKDNIIIIQQK
jgi:transcriptional regulator with XRE-family HTH domain